MKIYTFNYSSFGIFVPFYPMEADKIVHAFKPNSKFEDAVALYDFDTQLRSLMFEAIQ